LNETETDENNKAFHIEGYSDLKILDPQINRLTNAQVAQEFLQIGVFATVDDNLMMWDSPSLNWVDAEERIRRQIVLSWKEEATVPKVKEIIELMKILTVASLGDLEKDDVRYAVDLPASKIIVKNQVIDVESGNCEALGPWFYFTSKLPIEYDPAADCPAIKKFFSEIVAKEHVSNLEEVFGYCLLRKHLIHKGIMLVGDGSNGKTVFLNLLQAFLGEDAISDVAFQDMYPGSFYTWQLKGKLANIRDDLPSIGLKDTGTFKQLVGESLLQCHRKHRDTDIQFRNYAKLVFSCNRFPKTEDPSYAFERRWLIIPFPNRFSGERADKTLLSKLTTETELSGLLNLARKALKRLLEQGDFTNSLSPEETGDLIDRLSDPVAAFLDENTEDDPEAIYERDLAYAEYTKFTMTKGFETLPKRQFTISMQGRGYRLMRHRTKEGMIWVYQGLKPLGVPNVLVDRSLLDSIKDPQNCNRDILDDTFDTEEEKQEEP